MLSSIHFIPFGDTGYKIYLFPASSSKLLVPLNLREVSYRPHIIVFCFLIQPYCLFFSRGVFSPITFNVIADDVRIHTCHFQCDFYLSHMSFCSLFNASFGAKIFLVTIMTISLKMFLFNMNMGAPVSVYMWRTGGNFVKFVLFPLLPVFKGLNLGLQAWQQEP